MFQLSYPEWEKEVAKHLAKVENYADYILSQSKHLHLRSMEMVAGVSVYSFISEYVGVQLARLAARAGSQRQFLADGYGAWPIASTFRPGVATRSEKKKVEDIFCSCLSQAVIIIVNKIVSVFSHRVKE